MPCPECKNDRCHVGVQFKGDESVIIAVCTKCGLTTEATGSESLIKFLLEAGMPKTHNGHVRTRR